VKKSHRTLTKAQVFGVCCMSTHSHILTFAVVVVIIAADGLCDFNEYTEWMNENEMKMHQRQGQTASLFAFITLFIEEKEEMRTNHIVRLTNMGHIEAKYCRMY
jgi:hypothetical protein